MPWNETRCEWSRGMIQQNRTQLTLKLCPKPYNRKSQPPKKWMRIRTEWMKKDFFAHFSLLLLPFWIKKSFSLPLILLCHIISLIGFSHGCCLGLLQQQTRRKFSTPNWTSCEFSLLLSLKQVLQWYWPTGLVGTVTWYVVGAVWYVVMVGQLFFYSEA